MRKVIQVIAIIGGVLAAVTSLVLGAGLGLLAALGGTYSGAAGATMVGQGAPVLGTLALAGVVFGVGLGAAVAWHGWRSLQGRGSSPFRLPAWGWLLLALIVVLAAGQWVAASRLVALLPIFHILAAVIPALMFLSLSLGGARRLSGAANRLLASRPAWSSIAWGGLGGVGLAIVLELVLLLFLVVLASALLSLIDPGLMERLSDTLLRAQSNGTLDPSSLGPLLQSPLLILTVLLLASVLVPLIEESVKALAVPILALTGRRLARREAFLLGVASGAGFAMVEGVTNGALALAQPDGWAAAMAARAGAAALHCVVSGLAGLGWQAIIVEKKWLRGLGLGLAAVVLHGAWNAGAIASAWLSLQSSSGGTMGLAGNLLSLPVVALLGVIFLVALVILRWLPGRLAQTGTASGETTTASLS